MLIQPVFIAQQYRSQAMAENDKHELVPSQPADARKEAVLELITQINMKTRTSKAFLDMLGEKLLELQSAPEGSDVYEICKIEGTQKEMNKFELMDTSRES